MVPAAIKALWYLNMQFRISCATACSEVNSRPKYVPSVPKISTLVTLRNWGARKNRFLVAVTFLKRTDTKITVMSEARVEIE